MEVLGLVSTTNPNALKIVFDEEQESIDKGVTTFTAEVSKHFGLSEGNTAPDLSMIKAGNYFLYEGADGIAKVFTIIDVTSDSPDEIVSFYAEDGGLDIINEIVGDYEAKDAMIISKYFDLFLKNTGFKIGINELGTTYSRKLKWDGESSVTERLRSVAHQFDHAEINFSFKVKGMRVTQKRVNIYKKRGEETGITLELNRHVNRITATETIANLATSLSPKGSVPENKKEPITLKGHKYDDGRFFVENGFLRDRESNETWSRFLSEGRGAVGGYINKPYTYDTTNVVTLRNSAITELKKVSQVAKNFEIDIAVLPDEVRIGDTINIVNQKGELYLEARVLQLTRSRVEDKAVAVLGDYLIKESGINEKLFELSEQMKNIPQGDSSYLWIRYADDDKGTGFSASPVNKSYMAVKTVINQPIPSDNVEDYEGLWVLIQGEGVPGEPGQDGEPTYTWIRYADNVSGGGISANPQGKKYIGFAYNKDTATPSNAPKDYQWFLAKGEDGVNGSDGKNGVNGLPGADGKPTYTWIKYANGANGEGMTESPTSSTFFIGIAVNKLVQAESSNPSDYTWSKFVGEDGDDGVPGKPGADGKPTYTWMKYADTDKGTGMSNSPAGKDYIGFAYNKATAAESNVATDYIWSLIKGEDGKNGLSITSVQSLFYQSTSATSLVAGKWVTTAPTWESGKFSWTKTKTVFSDSTSSETVPVNITGGIGKDGKPTYTWLMYADDDKGKGISASPVGKYFIGFAYNKAVEKPSTVAKDYTWSAMYDEEKTAELQNQLNNLNYVGTNLWAPNYYKDNVGYIGNDDLIVINDAYRYTDYIPTADFKKITRTVFVIPTAAAGMRYHFYDKDKNPISYIQPNVNRLGSITTDIPDNTVFVRFYATPKFGGKIKVELGNKSTDYSISPLDTPTTGDLSNVQTELQQQLGSIVTPVMQPNRPTAKEGLVWWKTDVTGGVIGIEKYIGGKWEKQVIQQETLNIINLNAVKITGSEITGTEISGSALISTFDNTVSHGSPVRQRGTLTLDKGYALIKYEQYNENTPNVIINKGETKMDEYGINTTLKDSNDKVLVFSQYGPLGINIDDRSKPYGRVSLGYNDLVAIPEKAFASNMYESGFAEYSSSALHQPRYSRNNRLVQLSGAIRNNNVVKSNVITTMAVLPVEVRPARAVRVICQGSGMNRYLLTVTLEGELNLDRYGTNSQIDVTVGSWINIACTFVAGN